MNNSTPQPDNSDSQDNLDTNPPQQPQPAPAELFSQSQIASPTVSNKPLPKKLSSLLKVPVPILVVMVIIVLAGIFTTGHYILAQNTSSTATSHTKQKLPTVTTPVTKPQTQTTTTPSTSQPSTTGTTSSKPSTSTSSTTPPSTSPPSQTPSSAPAPTPAPNTTNCLPTNPTQYETTYANETNSQYLQANSYANTTKIYAALQFAGLIGTINSKQYVVLAMDDSQWSNFTQAQLNWMNASASNMRSVVGWQVITSCITWNGVNPVKNLAAGATQTVNTLNGAVTFTAQGGSGLGKFGNGSVGIWDWFTSNGSVAIAGFVNTASIP